MIASVKQAIKSTRICRRNAAKSGSREARTWNDHAVVQLIEGGRTGNEPRLGIDSDGIGWVITAWVKDGHVTPDRMIGNDDGVTKAIIDRQVPLSLPGILCETLPHASTKHRVCPMANLRVAVEEP